ncbi:TRAP transporter large permease [Rhodobacter calidifons]|uniref:TRAP transporter large permease subunit n=1 Tax=Rhodobacter calidifons TaxID=2715277 RepID=A0ABX0G8Y4_9RHOB|nr:TRAP transporter large permease subunit [Rhodobacter calidifons]NHB77328.1 TRAP transporter large permease subunit [Rhodobacter calidifons]
MIEILAHNMAPIIFASLVVFLLLGYPVAFSLAANGLIFFVIGVWLAPYSNGEITLGWPLLGTMPQRLWGIISNETLLAIPFFTFMGIILERSGMAEDLLDTIGQLFGPIRGGLAFAVVLVGALLAATTGVVAASVIAMGLISLPIMLRYGYDRRTATGVIAASGTLAQIIPPSLVLIILADQLGRSVGDMYRGAMVPGLVLTGMYLGYVAMTAIFQPHKVPALPPEARTLGGGVTSLLVALVAGLAISYGAHLTWYDAWGSNADVLGATIGTITLYLYALADRYLGLNLLSRLAQQVIMVLIPPLALIFLVLGTIFIGLATPTEGGAMGAVGAMMLAFAKGRFSFPMLHSALAATTRLSAFVLFVLIGARMFSLTFYGVNGHVWVEELLTAVPGGQYGFLVVVNLIIFVLGFFLDFFEIAFILIPLLIAPAQTLGIDLIWLGVIIGVNLQTSFLTPPFGFALFYLRSVAARVPYLDKVTGRKMEGIRTGEIYQGAIPFIVIQVLMIFAVVFFPQMVMHYKGPVVDPSTIEIRVPGFTPMAPGGTGTAPAAPGGGLPGLPGAPTLGAPTLGAPTLVAPTLGAPTLGAPNLGGTPPADGAPPAPGGLPTLPGMPQLGAPVVNP